MIEIGFDDDGLDRPASAAQPAPDRDWRILDDGLEHRASGYFIAREEIASRRGDGLWTWPMQLAEKAWCAPVGFHRVFTAALERYGVAADVELARSFALGFGIQDAGQRHNDRFVALGELVRPRTAERKRVLSGEGRRTGRERPRQGADTRAPALDLSRSAG
ncbi:hypothetical protein [Methylorubrum podarium]|uniref:hypothetical protein n=1 Tax=Methylorubrum podarium TaxID=200476 RepID=UPI001EE29052|nr:hypothetical protein [Methylorubrum podarium]MDV2984371.1 hypothetical protein [Methylobacteriaceae bacterium AG10]GJE71908.1 hypothetical protein CHKEEEPN_3460 [Methylorubrum podarium]